MYKILDYKKYKDKIVKLNIEALWNTACPDPDVYKDMLGLVIGTKEKDYTWSYDTEPDWLVVEIDNGDILWLDEDEVIIQDDLVGSVLT